MFDFPKVEVPSKRGSSDAKSCAVAFARIKKLGAPRAEKPMPYPMNADLPISVRAHLPEHAQDVYREAFNHAYAAHAGESRQEEAAHRIAWAVVKRSYVKVGDRWVGRHP
jgi:cation transport regulator